MIGSLLASRYRIHTLLGQGGMGVVHEAIDETTGARVAVKLVHSEMIREASSKDDASKLTRFLREAKAAAAIQGEHVARTLDWGTDEPSGRPFIVMELLEGEDLNATLKRVTQLPPDVALRIAAQACEGLVQAHLARVIHRDIKPANLFLARMPSGEIVVKILDFGIAKIRPEGESDGETTGLTRTGSMLGSPKYMSPEQARGVRSLDHRTDVWSLGVVLFRMLSGHLPHEDVTAIGEFIIMLCSEAPEPVQGFAPWVPTEIAEIVEDALRIDRDQRYESAEAMLATMRARLPNGYALRAEEIVSFDESAQAGAATQTPSMRPPGSRTGDRTGDRSADRSLGGLTASGEATSQMPARSALRLPAAARRDDSATPGSMAGFPLDTVSSSPAPRRTLPFAVGMGVGALILAALVFGLSRGADLISDRPVTSAAPSTGGPAPLGSESANRPVNVVILPNDARVEIDGVAASAADGVVKIVGAIGSSHRVRVSKDGQEKIADVTIGPSGAEPPKVELLAVAAPSAIPSTRPLGGPRPPTKKSATPGAPTPPRNPLIPERFE
ncbi:MAG: serine/threonine-protein kinase [Byssovorax sp.]